MKKQSRDADKEARLLIQYLREDDSDEQIGSLLVLIDKLEKAHRVMQKSLSKSKNRTMEHMHAVLTRAIEIVRDEGPPKKTKRSKYMQ